MIQFFADLLIHAIIIYRKMKKKNQNEKILQVISPNISFKKCHSSIVFKRKST